MDERTKTETYIRKMNTFAIGSLPVHFSVAKLFTFRWQYTTVSLLMEMLVDFTSQPLVFDLLIIVFLNYKTCVLVVILGFEN